MVTIDQYEETRRNNSETTNLDQVFGSVDHALRNYDERIKAAKDLVVKLEEEKRQLIEGLRSRLPVL